MNENDKKTSPGTNGTVKRKRIQKSNCDYCVHYEYDELSGETVCSVSLDEDEFEHYLTGAFRDCPYYQPYDEYKSVQKQN